MLSHLKSYLFGTDGGVMTQQPPAEEAGFNGAIESHGEEEDWVLVDSQEISSSDDDEGHLVPNALEESWIVTQESTTAAAVVSVKAPRRGHRQPKGTKPRRWRGRKNSNSSSSNGPATVCKSLDDTGSTSSSIAVLASPGPANRSVAPPSPAAAASAVLAASSDVKQVAAMAAARAAKAKSDKKQLSRKSLYRGNQTAMAASCGNGRRSHLIATRICGSNNNRKSHQF